VPAADAPTPRGAAGARPQQGKKAAPSAGKTPRGTASAGAPVAAKLPAADKPRRAARPVVAPAPAPVPAATHGGAAALAWPAWTPSFAADDRRNRLITYALGISIAVHMVLLAIRFQPFDLKSMLDRGPPLEVALVNARSPTKPTKADILAQANLDGGGNTDANRRAKTPLPALPKDNADSQITVATQQVERLERQTKEMLTQLKSQPTAPPAPKPVEAVPTPELPTATELMQRTLEAMRLEAQIAKQMDAYQKRPKRRFVGARAEEYRFARYVEDWRLKVERVGNLNYPEAARQLKLYGNLLITVSIRSDGSVEQVEINRSSGQRVLDAAARKIVEMAAPYAPFPPDIKRDTDILHITRTWSFTKSDELVSE
jgi:periplasmic protein TonB